MLTQFFRRSCQRKLNVCSRWISEVARDIKSSDIAGESQIFNRFKRRHRSRLRSIRKLVEKNFTVIHQPDSAMFVGDMKYTMVTPESSRFATIVRSRIVENDPHSPGVVDEAVLKMETLSKAFNCIEPEVTKLCSSADHRYVGLIVKIEQERKLIIWDSSNDIMVEVVLPNRLIQSVLTSRAKQFDNVGDVFEIENVEFGDNSVSVNRSKISTAINLIVLVSNKSKRPCALLDILIRAEQISSSALAKLKGIDNRKVGYNKEQKNQRLTKHRLEMTNVRVLYAECDPAFYLDLYRTRDGRSIFLSCHSKSSSEVFLVRSGTGRCRDETELVALAPRLANCQYFVDICQQHLFVATTNDIVFACPVDKDLVLNKSQKSQSGIKLFCAKLPVEVDLFHGNNSPNVRTFNFYEWLELMPPRDDFVKEIFHHEEYHTSDFILEDYEIFRNHVVLFGRRNGEIVISSVNHNKETSIDGRGTVEGAASRWKCVCLHEALRNNYKLHAMAIEAQIAVVNPQGCNHWRSPTMNFSVGCAISPKEISFELDLSTNMLTHVNKIDTLETSCEGTTFNCWLEQVISEGNCRVPLSLVEKSDVSSEVADNLVPRPLLLIGYGAYGLGIPMHFQPELLTLLEMGWILGFAHIRGGGGYGPSWHDNGKGMKKINGFDDFLSCALHVISRGLTDSSLLCARVESAGGLVGGYMINMYPEYFAGIVFRSPFLAILDTMKQAALPLTLHEQDEWGNVISDPPALCYIESYCPLQNIGRKLIRDENNKVMCKPSVFISVGLLDQRVRAWESVHYAQKLRHCRGETDSENSSVVLDLKPDCGHDGPLSTDTQIDLLASEILFLEATSKSAFGSRYQP